MGLMQHIHMYWLGNSWYVYSIDCLIKSSIRGFSLITDPGAETKFSGHSALTCGIQIAVAVSSLTGLSALDHVLFIE